MANLTAPLAEVLVAWVSMTMVSSVGSRRSTVTPTGNRQKTDADN